VGWRSRLLAVTSIFCIVDIIIGLIIGVVFSSSSGEPEPATNFFEDVFIAVAPQNIQEGTIIE
jgi:hypothetical protein